MKETPTLAERIDQFLATAPRSRPWYDTRNRRWHPGHVYVTKCAAMAMFMEYRRDRALQAMAELDAEIAAEEAAEKRRLARASVLAEDATQAREARKRKTCAKSKRQRSTR